MVPEIRAAPATSDLPSTPLAPPPPPPPIGKDRYPYQNLSRNHSSHSQTLQVMSSPDLYGATGRDGAFSSTTSIRRPHHRKLHFLTSLATLKHWLLESARRAASPATSKQHQQKLMNGNASHSSHVGQNSQTKALTSSHNT